MIKSQLYKKLKLLIPALCLVSLVGCSQLQSSNTDNSTKSQVETTKGVSKSTQKIDLASIPAFSNKAYITINDNNPYFTDSDYSTESFETYSDLDSLGRCGVAYANIGKDLMPTEKRGDISSVKPSGWHSVKYDNVDGKSLYNRCHLIGYQLTAENANEKNLITGTRYLNVDGMLPFENMVADYIKETGNHVLYRVTPVFEGDNLVASGVQMEAKSVEDKGKGICFNIYAYNNQPGIAIDYANGDSHLTSTGQSGTSSVSAGSNGSKNSNSTSTSSSSGKNSSSSSNSSKNTASTNKQTSTSSTQSSSTETYVLNKDTHKFHKPSCADVKKISADNREDYNGSRDQLISDGYMACKKCNP